MLKKMLSKDISSKVFPDLFGFEWPMRGHRRLRRKVGKMQLHAFCQRGHLGMGVLLLVCGTIANATLIARASGRNHQALAAARASGQNGPITGPLPATVVRLNTRR